jgi:DNA polymerase V
MVAIVDCNSFYCSCERLFRPDLRRAPVVVLSNNDGCIIARTDEAKSLGIGMAAPYWQYRELIRSSGVEVFSSNYHLYGDMSARVMDTLRTVMGEHQARTVEVYSVDEAFVSLSHVPPTQVRDLATRLRDTVTQWTGIQVSVGVAPTKLLSKVANRLAKRDKAASGCLCILDTEEGIRDALERMPVGDLWGVGGRYAAKLRDYFGIRTAWQLRQMPEAWAHRHMGGVVGVRLHRELRGIPSIGMKDQLERKDMISTSRMFGKPVFDRAALREAVAAFTARAAEKLRRQYSAAASIDVYAVTAGEQAGSYVYQPATDHRFVLLGRPTALTHELIRAAMPLVDQLYQPGAKYLKAGVILGGLVPETAIQQALFTPSADPRMRALMDAVDNINAGMRADAVRYVASGLTRQWTMRQDMRSRRHTTRWEELFIVD